ncbi:2-keto-4-pentenoate hydratase/2-oxohepta-3-ene-1,7-dioic acid hydratase in catechol pathway [Cryobacterium sp. MP_3.1]|uniref:fumarylacetoacetate hydrolase family protein n=1 Tax=Cryobacterium sp. MP_3.1 TaxID=3071711 RepID=UPI002E0664D2|nr:2-keto-4-pentenoate hydratase/2-oxohepta-3-ene-1,7-dioic acid hydratase in catechol pathway [Cryobacterium sp. MP_3.1]
MRIARLDTPTGPRHAVALGGRWHLIMDPYGTPFVYTGESISEGEAVLLASVDPRVVVGIGHNKPGAALPMQAWHKSVHTVAGTGDDIPAVRDVGTVNIEGELAVVIGRTASNLTLANAFEAVLGYTVANDVTNVDQGAIDERNFQGKSGTNYTPLGPWIETELADPENVATEVVINGAVVAQSGSFNLPSSVAATLVYVTRWLTLEAGDVVLTGAPGTDIAVTPGDTVDITLAGIGTLRNTIV